MQKIQKSSNKKMKKFAMTNTNNCYFELEFEIGYRDEENAICTQQNEFKFDN